MYLQEISRAHPTCIVILLDQSHSMTEEISTSTQSKISSAIKSINSFISELIIMCDRGDSTRHWFDIGVIGFTTDQADTPVIGSILSGALAARDLISIVDLSNNVLEFETRKQVICDEETGGLIEHEYQVSIWCRVPETYRMAGTSTTGALQYCRDVLSDWCGNHQYSFPPTVVLLTDGESTDGDPSEAADALKSLTTLDGNVLLCTIHLASSVAGPVVFPSVETQLQDDLGKRLFRMSSSVPDTLLALRDALDAHSQLPLMPGSRLVVYNADQIILARLLSFLIPGRLPNRIQLR